MVREYKTGPGPSEKPRSKEGELKLQSEVRPELRLKKSESDEQIRKSFLEKNEDGISFEMMRSNLENAMRVIEDAIDKGGSKVGQKLNAEYAELARKWKILKEVSKEAKKEVRKNRIEPGDVIIPSNVEAPKGKDAVKEQKIKKETPQLSPKEDAARLVKILEEHPDMMPGNRKRIEGQLKIYQQSGMDIRIPQKEEKSFFGGLFTKVSSFFGRGRRAKERNSKIKKGQLTAYDREVNRKGLNAIKNKEVERAAMQARAEDQAVLDAEEKILEAEYRSIISQDSEVRRIEKILRENPKMLKGNKKRYEMQLQTRKDEILEELRLQDAEFDEVA